MRAIYNTLPFHKVPGCLVIEMAKTEVFWLNAFTPFGGASRVLSPRTILTGQKVDYKRHCRFQCGEYAQTHEEHDNSMNPRTVGALALRPVGNGQGSFYFLSVTTGRVLNRLHATALPMPDEVIDKIHRITRQQKNNSGLIFAGRNLQQDEWDDDDDDEDDETYHNDDDDDTDDDDDDDDPHDDDDPNIDDDMLDHHDNENEEDDDNSDHNDEGEEDVDNEDGGHDDVEADGNPNEDMPDGNVMEDGEPIIDDAPPLGDIQQIPGDAPGGIPGVGVDEAEDGVGANHNIPQDMDDETPPGIPGVDGSGVDETVDEQATLHPDANTNMVGGYGLRNKRGRNYDHRYAGENFVVGEDVGITLTTTESDQVMETPQMSLKAGLRTFGDDGLKPVEKEMRQLHDRSVMKPVHKGCLTVEQRREVLAYLMFLKRKRCGKIKGRGCADSRKQRAYITKEDSTAPTVSTEAVFLTAVIDAMEGRNVVVLDVPGAFTQADIDELVHIRFTGAMVTLLLEIDYDMYKEYVVVEKGERVMYMELLKALYGTLRAARLFSQKLSKQLIDEWGFTPNKYDDCVVNKMINGQQMTVVWHVDDLKVSHVDASEVEKFVQRMEATFGQDTPLTVSRGQVHDYLGMTLDFRTKGEVQINMEHYIDMML